jgi:hypothetical protein
MSDLLQDQETTRSAIASTWTKGSLSTANGNCVEVVDLPDRQVGMRDSKNAGGLVLRFPPEEWRAFMDSARHGQGDRFSTRERNVNVCHELVSGSRLLSMEYMYTYSKFSAVALSESYSIWCICSIRSLKCWIQQ